MKTKHALIIFVFVVLMVSIITVVLTYRSNVKQEFVYDMDVTVTDDGIVGVNIDADALHFGSMAAGSASRRYINVHQVQEAFILKALASGEMAKWVTVDQGPVQKGQEKNISVVLSVPEGVAVGNYSGQLKILLLKP